MAVSLEALPSSQEVRQIKSSLNKPNTPAITADYKDYIPDADYATPPQPPETTHYSTHMIDPRSRDPSPSDHLDQGPRGHLNNLVSTTQRQSPTNSLANQLTPGSFESFDLDGDGVINRQEFQAVSRKASRLPAVPASIETPQVHHAATVDTMPAPYTQRIGHLVTDRPRATQHPCVLCNKSVNGHNCAACCGVFCGNCCSG